MIICWLFMLGVIVNQYSKEVPLIFFLFCLLGAPVLLPFFLGLSSRPNSKESTNGNTQ